MGYETSDAVQPAKATLTHRCLFGAFDVEALANSGSFLKAVSLVAEKAVTILIRCADGSVEASVRSEHSNDTYDVRVEPRPCGKLVARCTCFDFKRRGGLCKHGASVVLAIQHESVSDTVDVGQVQLSFETTPAPKRRRAEAQMNGAGKPKLDKLPEPSKELQRRAADAFAVVADRKVAEDIRAEGAFSREQTRRCVKLSLKASLAAKLIKSKVSAGDATGFSSELQRRGAEPLEDVEALLHTALQNQNEAGGRSIAAAILNRPEGAAVVNTAIGVGRVTPLHVAVLAGRLESCQLLLAHKADVSAQDSLSRTPVDLARSRRIDADDFRKENSFLKLLQEASEASHVEADS